jgi:ketosteroid isomerase-like protein
MLLQKTQEFSDAGQKGDGATMERLLDDRVVFFNENGDAATKKDLASTSPTQSQGRNVKMTVTDWDCEVRGNIAVASFIDDQVVTSNGAVIHAQYRSVETWIKEGDDWRMLSSLTLALQADPTAVTLPSTVLEEYVGSYEAAPGKTFTFSLNRDELMASQDGGPATVQKAEVRDVFFTPGRGRFRIVFQRDGRGRVVALAYRHEGHDRIFKRI